MSALRSFRPRLFRPHLSNRYQYLCRRAESTATSAQSTSTQAHPKSSFFRRNRSTIIWSSLAAIFGVMGGQFVVHTLSPPPLPETGSREDGILMADLNKRIDEEFKVEVLRSKCREMANQLKGEDGWVEVLPLPLELNEKENMEQGLVARMQGAKGFGVERLFWDRSENTLVAVMWLGGSLCGWPGVIHGGAVATSMTEKLSLAAALADKNSSDVRAAATPQRLPGTGNHAKMVGPATTPDEPAQLSMGYVKPTLANQFYVIRVRPAAPQELGPEKIVDRIEPSEPYGGAEYDATLETLDGKVCAKARAKFAPSTVSQRAKQDISSDAKQNWTAFREWMWPSRQKQSQF